MRERTSDARLPLVLAWLAASVVVALVGVSFFTATTFIGDDHLFLAFARYVADPLTAFVRDQHGGEFYRPIPMALWWVLTHGGRGAQAPFALLSFALHVLVSVAVAKLILVVRSQPSAQSGTESPAEVRRAAFIAAALFFLSPLTQDAAFWYAASTDLLATAFGLGAVITWMRGRAGLAAACLAVACWSKEHALIIPALAASLLWLRGGTTVRSLARRLTPLICVAVLYGAARTLVLGGLGRSGDQTASLAGKVVQICAGLLRVTGPAVSRAGWAWPLGFAVWAAMLVASVSGMRSRSRRDRRVAAAPLVWVAVSVLPLLAAPWVVGARYFYLATVGVVWLAADVLARARPAVLVGVLAAVAGLDLAQGLERAADVRAYQGRLSAARRAVVDGVSHGARTFHVTAGIKDLDLAVKEDPLLDARDADLLVLGDVPASFVAVPPDRLAALDFLVAHPPLPPGGAYRFGARRIVGLARRGDDPTLAEVIAHFPDIRFLRLRPGPGGRVIVRDLTDSVRDTAAGTDSDSAEDATPAPRAE